MTIHLPKELESSILSAVEKGEFASLDDAMTKAARLLLESLPQEPTDEKRLTPAEDSAFDVANRAGLIGCIQGSAGSPTDLSTNPKHMEGFGRA